MRCHEICNSNRKRGRRREKLRQRQLTHAAADKLRLQLESPCSAVYLHAGTRSHMTLAHTNTHTQTHTYTHTCSAQLETLQVQQLPQACGIKEACSPVFWQVFRYQFNCLLSLTSEHNLLYLCTCALKLFLRRDTARKT